MENEFTIVRLSQGTAKWLTWRRDGIGASDAPAIMGENRWKTPSQVLADKLGVSKEASSPAMERGSALEPEARRQYEKALNVRVKPECLKSNTYDWLRASVDGLSHDDQLVVEIKCGESVQSGALAATDLNLQPLNRFARIEVVRAPL